MQLFDNLLIIDELTPEMSSLAKGIEDGIVSWTSEGWSTSTGAYADHPAAMRTRRHLQSVC